MHEYTRVTLSVLTFVAIVAIVAIMVIQLVNHRRNRKRLILPPGPKGYPIIGNAFDIPKGYDPVIWAKYRDLYGPMTAFSSLGTCVIIINDIKVAQDIFDKRSILYSDRPSDMFSGELIGWSRVSAFYQYRDERFRLARKFMSQMFGSKKAVKKFHEKLDFEARRFLVSVHEQPDNLMHHARAWAGATILRITYGYNVSRDDDDVLIRNVDRTTREFNIASKPGVWLVDIIPSLSNLPGWLPGMGFKKLAKKYRDSLDLVAKTPLDFTKAQMASGVAPESYASRLLRTSSEDEETVKWTAFSVYSGGADTTVSTLYAFYLAMMLYPDVQKRAQTEIDSVVGTDRLPIFADRKQLPYVNAVLKEILRWNTAVPFGLPHVASGDGTYNGYFIPKGAVIMPNIWLFNHDPSNFEDPDSFKPERFLNDNSPAIDPYNTSFGFGRRICPGIELADASIFVTIAMSLAVFEIKRAVGEENRTADSYLKWKKEFISHPVDFRCQIKPRSAKAKSLLQSIPEEYPLPPSDADALSALRL